MTDLQQSCVALNTATENDQDRVGLIADEKPACACESETFSVHSPGLVGGAETIVRVVCVPMHVHSKRPELKSSFFSHVTSFGASVQRLEISKTPEILGCVEGLLAGKEDRVWLGYVEAAASAIRDEKSPDGTQSFCVADAALVDNQAHGEIHCAARIPAADEIEYRAALMRVFNAKIVLNRRSLQAGAVWAALKDEFKDRALPKQWDALA